MQGKPYTKYIGNTERMTLLLCITTIAYTIVRMRTHVVLRKGAGRLIDEKSLVPIVERSWKKDLLTLNGTTHQFRVVEKRLRWTVLCFSIFWMIWFAFDGTDLKEVVQKLVKIAECNEARRLGKPERCK